MPLRKHILDGLTYLLRFQNEDGGIPATRPGEVSGCWTTAETIESLLTSAYQLPFDIRPKLYAMLRFLVNTQIASGDDLGGWPLVEHGAHASTMATGHAVAALATARVFLASNDDQQAEIDIAVKQGFQWLAAHRNEDYSWGVEPSAGASGRESRVISTVYALRAYIADGRTYESNPVVRNGVEWLLTRRMTDGGFAPQANSPSDTCTTARIVTTLLRARYGNPDTKVIREAMKYLIRTRPRRRLWPLNTESYVAEGAPGQTVYNSNTAADVLEALLRAGRLGREVRLLIDWFRRNQEESGYWYLGANQTKSHDVITWATNEAIYVLNVASQVLAVQGPLVTIPQTARWLMVLISVIAAIELAFLIGVPSHVSRWWYGLGADTRNAIVNVIVVAVILAIIVNIAAAFLYDRLKDWLARRE